MNFDTSTPGRILGIGGIFFKSASAETLRSWYGDKLGLPSGPDGTVFPWRSHQDPSAEHMTVWSIFKDSSDYFGAGQSKFMINYIVDDLDAFLKKCESGAVSIDPKREDHSYGRFAWIFDPEGNKIELWQPIASESGKP
jgi:predicted enzyme related to lactoylglutathione lyase